LALRGRLDDRLGDAFHRYAMVAIARGRVEPREQFVILFHAGRATAQDFSKIGRSKIGHNVEVSGYDYVLITSRVMFGLTAEREQ
jgi:hypothetical protein